MPARLANTRAATVLPPPSRRILDAARVHLFTYGYSALTMDGLATELGMSKKTLYVHFHAQRQQCVSKSGDPRSTPKNRLHVFAGQRCPEEDSNLYAPEGAGGFKPRLRRPGSWFSSSAIA